MMISNRKCNQDSALAASSTQHSAPTSFPAKKEEVNFYLEARKLSEQAEPMPELSPFQAAAQVSPELIAALSQDAGIYGPNKFQTCYSSGRAEKAFKVLDTTPSKPVNVYSSSRAEKSFKVMGVPPSKPVSVYSSSRAERSFNVIDATPSKPVSVYSSGRAEKAFNTMDVLPSKPVSVYSSSRAERSFHVIDDTPSKPVSVYSSSRAERAFKVMEDTPSKPVSVYSSSRAEKACAFRSEFDLEQFDLFAEVITPLAMMFPDEDEGEPKPTLTPAQTKVWARPPVFSSRRAESGCNLPRTQPYVPTNIYSSGRAERACCPVAVVEDTPEPAMRRPRVDVYSSSRAERSFQVMEDTPSKPVSVYSSGRAEKAFKVIDATPSKPVSVYSSGRAERAFKTLDGTPSKAVNVFSSGLAEGRPLPEWHEESPEPEHAPREVSESWVLLDGASTSAWLHEADANAAAAANTEVGMMGRALLRLGIGSPGSKTAPASNESSPGRTAQMTPAWAPKFVLFSNKESKQSACTETSVFSTPRLVPKMHGEPCPDLSLSMLFNPH